MITMQPPVDMTLEAHHQAITDIISFIREISQQGNACAEFSQAELDKIVADNELTQKGKFFLNRDTGALQKSTQVGPNIVITDVG